MYKHVYEGINFEKVKDQLDTPAVQHYPIVNMYYMWMILRIEELEKKLNDQIKTN